MNRLCIQLRGQQQVTRLAASGVEENDDDNQLIAKDEHGKIIGKFNLSEIAGWWTETI